MDARIAAMIDEAPPTHLAEEAGASVGFIFSADDRQIPIMVEGHAPATHLAYEWTEYGVSYPGAAVITVGGIRLDRFPGCWFRLRFENHLGLAELRAYDAGGRLLGEPLQLLVLSKKFPALHEHVSFYGALLDDLFRRLIQLPFVVSAPTGQQVEEAMRPPGPIFALHFFAHEAERIASALRTIQAMPHRGQTSDAELLPVHAVTSIDPDALLDIVRTPGRWRQSAHARSPLAQKLGGYLPESIWQQLARDTLDTPENRFVLGAAWQFAQGLEIVRHQSWWGSVPAPQLQRLDLLAGVVHRFLQDPKFAEVGAFSRPPSSSRVLLRKDGYRDLFALWNAFQRARRPLFAALDAAMAVRDVATLYEYWVYFRLIDELAEITGEQPVLDPGPDRNSGLSWRATTRFGEQGVLHYNRSETAYSRISLRPDMLWKPTSGAPVAFDAKFRLRTALDGTDRWNEDDLVKMHAYRDALGVRASVAIYPGDVTEFWPGLGSTPIPSLTELFRGAFSGIGAVARQPGNHEETA